MNYKQRFYDSYDRSTYDYKVTNSYYHFKNIQNIIYRKPEYNPYMNLRSRRLNLQMHPLNNNYKNDYLTTRQNAIYKKIINDIRNAEVKPKLNLYHKMKEEKIKEYRRASKTLELKELKRENSRFHKRLRSQKSLLKLREMDQEYKLNHQKLLDRSRRINQKYLILPPVNSIMKKFQTSASKKYLKTQGNDYLDKMKLTEPHQSTMRYNN
jgi:hypothetical protein